MRTRCLLVCLLGAPFAQAFAAAPLNVRADGTQPDGEQEQDRERDEDVVLAVVVTGTAGVSAFVDRGSDDGLEPGDRVLFLPAGRPAVVGEVRAVSSRSARVELGASGAVDVGDGGEVRVPKARLDALAAAAAATSGAGARTHPPWTQPPENWSADQPLLAPPRTIEPADRDVVRRGRAFLQLDSTREGTGTSQLFGRAGLDLTYDNLFGRGGRLEFDAEVATRRFDDGIDSDSDSRLRVQRFSYAAGGDRGRPDRWQVGRFLQQGFVEFGLLDGVEVVHRTSGDAGAPWHVGAAIGLLPEPTFELGSGRDTQIALHARRAMTGSTGLAYGLGYQKTLHDGDADRDLFAFDADWRPTKQHSLHASALVDWYTSGERAKSAGPELTELHLFTDWRPSTDLGFGLNFDRTRLPDIDREGFAAIPAATLSEQLFERAGVRGWWRATSDLRLSARLDRWRNEADDGAGGEVRTDWSGLPWSGSHASLALFANDGAFTSVEGARLGLDRSTSIGFWQITYGLTQVDEGGAVLGDGDRLEQSVRASWDHTFGATSTSLSVERLFGDGQDATSVGIYLQQRF